MRKGKRIEKRAASAQETRKSTGRGGGGREQGGKKGRNPLRKGGMTNWQNFRLGREIGISQGGTRAALTKNGRKKKGREFG